MSINFSNTTPAAPSGKTLITFQTDGQGNFSGYTSTATELIGDGVDLTGQTADVGSATLVASPANGLYRISITIIVTVVDGASSTLPDVVITYADQDNGQTQTLTLVPSTPNGNTLTTLAEGDMIVSAGSTANITYATSGYASGTPNTMTFALHIRVEAM